MNTKSSNRPLTMNERKALREKREQEARLREAETPGLRVFAWMLKGAIFGVPLALIAVIAYWLFSGEKRILYICLRRNHALSAYYAI